MYTYQIRMIDQTFSDTFINDTLFFMGSLVIGGVIAAWIISYIIYDKKSTCEDIQKILDNDTDDEVIELPFEEKYLNELKALEQKEFSNDEKKALKKKHHKEKTPMGFAIITYDDDVFIYYCRNGQSMPYKYLDTLARKFVIENNCRDIYVPLELENNKKSLQTEVSTECEDSETDTECEESIFVKLKSKIKNTITSKTEIVKKMNKFKYGGLIEDFEKKSKVEKENEQPKKINFSDYKKLLNSIQDP